MRTLYLCGGGNSEGVRLALRVNEAERRWDRMAILDDDTSKHGRRILDVPVEGGFGLLATADPRESDVQNLVARTAARRWAAHQKIARHGLPFATLISPGVDLAGVSFDPDILVYGNAVLGPEVTIDASSVVFMGAVVGHESIVGKGCIVATNAVLNARVVLEEGVYVGTNATILPEVTVGAWATIGAGSVVVQDVQPGETVFGVPAQVIKPADGREVGNRRASSTDPVESTLREIWCTVLDTDHVERDDNFFGLGGNSLAAIRIVAEIQDAFGIELPLISLFKAPTIAAISDRIHRERLRSVPDDDLRDLMDELKNMSDDQVRNMLQQS